VFGLLLLTHAGRAESFIFMGDSSGEAGFVLDVPVRLVTPGGVAALQFDILYDPAVATVGLIQAGSDQSSHTVDSQNIASGIMRVLITSANNSPLVTGDLARVAVTLSSAVAEGSRSLFMDNIIFSSDTATRVVEHRLTGVAIGDSSGSNGATVDMPLNLTSVNDVVALQFDVRYDSAAATLGSIGGGSALASHTVDSDAIDSNTTRVIIIATNSDRLNDGGLASVMVTLASAVAENNQSLSIENVIVSDNAGKPVPEALIPYINVTSPQPSQQIDEAEVVTLSGLSADSNANGSIASVEFFVNGQSLGVATQPPYTTTWTATLGENILTAVATDNSGFTAIAQRVLANVGGTPFDAWLDLHFTPSEQSQPTISGPLSDPDNDGIINLLEYAFGFDPGVAARNGGPTVLSVEEGGQKYLAFQFDKPVSASDLVYVVEVSSNIADPGAWNSGAGHTVTISTVTVGDVETTVIRDALPIDQQNLRIMRLKVSAPGL